MNRVTLKGDKELAIKLKAGTNLDAVKTIVQKHSDAMNRAMKRNTKTAFKKGYTTGETARSINTVISPDRLTGTVQPTTDYAAYVEYGTRYMAAEPFVKPAFDAEKDKFKADIKAVTS